MRIYGNNVAANSNIYSVKTIVIDLLSFKADGILICSEGDIVIRSTDVDFKGIIYAPNETVRIESSNFNLKGRIIANNIVYQGNVFNGETYEGDLEFFN